MARPSLDRHEACGPAVKSVLFWLILQLAVWCPPAEAGQPIKKLPGDSAQYLPMLNNEINTYWPDLAPREYIPAQIDQESNWKQNAHLRTTREHGCGWGQFTIAYNADGSVRFDALTETKRLDKSLAGWDWQDCTNARYQLRAVVLKVKSAERACAATMRENINVKACNSAKYNGGSGSVDKRIRFCRAIKGCDPQVWENNLENQCPQGRVKVKGYGESFCEINSKYPGRVFDRMKKFKDAMNSPISKPLETNPLTRDVLPPK